MDEVRDKIRTIFEAPNASVHLVATGTAANCLILSTPDPAMAKDFLPQKRPYRNRDECAAPEFFTLVAQNCIFWTGRTGGLTRIYSPKRLKPPPPHGVHNAQLGCLSLTSVNELGGVYSLPQLRDLCDIAARFDMPVHLDGARFAQCDGRAGVLGGGYELEMRD